MHMTPDQVHAYFARRGLRDKKDYVLNGLRPKGHTNEWVPGLEFNGRFWQTYRARDLEKSAVYARASFDVAAAWVVEMAKAAGDT